VYFVYTDSKGVVCACVCACVHACTRDCICYYC